MQLASLLQKRRRKKGDEKGVGKAGSQESGDRREEEENLAREQVRQCSCSLVLCVCVVCRCTVNECIEDACSVCVCEYIQGILHVCWDVRVSTAGRRDGSTAGRRCALQSASPPGTG